RCGATPPRPARRRDRPTLHPPIPGCWGASNYECSEVGGANPAKPASNRKTTSTQRCREKRRALATDGAVVKWDGKPGKNAGTNAGMAATQSSWASLVTDQ